MELNERYSPGVASADVVSFQRTCRTVGNRSPNALQRRLRHRFIQQAPGGLLEDSPTGPEDCRSDDECKCRIDKLPFQEEREHKSDQYADGGLHTAKRVA